MIDKPEQSAVFVEWLRKGLSNVGHEEGKSLMLDVHWAYGDDARFPALARRMLRRNPAMILSACGPALRAIRTVNRTIPVVAICAEWNNYLGEVASMARPGGATTGFMILAPESAGRRLQLLKALRPGLSRVAILHNRIDDWRDYWREIEQAASELGITLLRLPPIERGDDLPGSLARAVEGRAEALITFPDATTQGAAARIAAFAIKHRLLTAFDNGTFAEAGGLLAYGPDWRDVGERVLPRYVDRILKGASPAELPIERPTKFWLDINLRTARALGLTIPPAMLLQANRVIE